MEEKEVNVDAVRTSLLNGTPFDDCLRPYIWSLLQGRLGSQSEEWESTLERDERRYRELQETIFGSESANPSSSVGGELAMKAVNPGEHPLAAEPASGSWERYMRSQRAEEQITRDVERLHPDNPLFRGSCAENAHKERLRRALMLFTATSSHGYVQGLHELIAIPYIGCSKAKRGSPFARDPEAHAFFLLSELMGEFGDLFLSEGTEVQSFFADVMRLLSCSDPSLTDHMHQHSVSPELFMFRWATMLFSMEFDVHNVLQMWDAIHAWPGDKKEYLKRLCVVMLSSIRNTLLASDFAGMVHVLQNYQHHYPVSSHCLSELIRQASFPESNS